MYAFLACAGASPADSPAGDSSSTPPIDSANVISTDFPASMSCGAAGLATVGVQNSGTTTWNPDDYKLGAVGDQDDFASSTRVYLDADVAPGGEVTFSIPLTAPGTPGSYVSDWQMVHEEVRWFGEDLTPSIDVGC